MANKKVSSEFKNKLHFITNYEIGKQYKTELCHIKL